MSFIVGVVVGMSAGVALAGKIKASAERVYALITARVND